VSLFISLVGLRHPVIHVHKSSQTKKTRNNNQWSVISLNINGVNYQKKKKKKKRERERNKQKGMEKRTLAFVAPKNDTTTAKIIVKSKQTVGKNMASKCT
jgi:hypothetical protein